jgi:shikimate kinase
MKGKASAKGAITIVNAIACGKGSAMSIDLSLVAEVEITKDSKDIEVFIEGEEKENPSVVKEVIKLIFEREKIDGYGAFVKTSSKIPIAKGLKSSSACSNAVALAAYSALGKVPSGLDIVNLGVNASINANVTITGAFDDACASYFGGIVVCDNIKRKLIKREEAKDYKVVILLPEKRLYTSSFNLNSAKSIARFVDEAFNLAMLGKYWQALTINGLLYSMVTNVSYEPVIRALKEGAIASGLSGTGPAISAVCESNEIAKRVIEAWEDFGYEIILTRTTNKGAELYDG